MTQRTRDEVVRWLHTEVCGHGLCTEDPKDCPLEVGEKLGVAWDAGRLAEREAVVGWLKTQSSEWADKQGALPRVIVDGIEGHIFTGSHLGPPAGEKR